MSESVILDKDGKEFKNATKIRLFTVELTAKEMQTMANAVTGFVNVLTQQKKMLEPETTMQLISALNKFKAAADTNKYRITEIENPSLSGLKFDSEMLKGIKEELSEEVKSGD
jgi:hypothetical protein